VKQSYCPLVLAVDGEALSKVWAPACAPPVSSLFSALHLSVLSNVSVRSIPLYLRVLSKVSAQSAPLSCPPTAVSARSVRSSVLSTVSAVQHQCRFRSSVPPFLRALHTLRVLSTVSACCAPPCLTVLSTISARCVPPCLSPPSVSDPFLGSSVPQCCPPSASGKAHLLMPRCVSVRSIIRVWLLSIVS